MPARPHTRQPAIQVSTGAVASTAASPSAAKAEATARARRAIAAEQKLARRRRAMQRRHPRLSRLLCWLLSAVLGSAGIVYAQVPTNALPAGGRVVVGAGQLQQGSNLLIVNQTSQRLGMDWQSFNIGSGATVEFRQPGASSVALNRILGNSGTEIYGQLRANGQVFLTNPHGVLFAPGSKVDVGGLVASTLDLSQEDFAAGRYIFSGSPQPGARVLNQGTLRASAGGYLALFGQHVENQGDISVNAGAVVLASGRAATVSISGSGLISAVVTPGEAGSVTNSGSIAADGGVVTLNAHSAQSIAESLVNNSGIVRANTLVERSGEIWITGDRVTSTGTLLADATGTADAGRIGIKGGMEHGSLEAGGTISARAEQGAGGQVETSAAQVRIAPDMRVATLSDAGRHGTWLIDPTNFTVAAGAGALGTSGIGADTLSANLNAGNVSLATATSGTEPGDIFVNAPLSWSASTRLTLTANRNVDINASVSASGDAAALFIVPGTGGSFNMATGTKVTMPGSKSQVDIAGVRYISVRTLADLQALDGTAAALIGNYVLVNDIDASSTATGVGFNPIGNETTTTVNATNSFSGRFQGLGNSIVGLSINRPTSNATGLFASTTTTTTVGAGTTTANIQNLVLSGGNIAGSQSVGALVGTIGGNTVINNVRSSAAVSGVDDSSSGVLVGGLVGDTGTTTGTSITRSAATGAVSGDTNAATAHVGGLIGELAGGTLSNVSASGAVTATLRTGTGASSHYVGGLVGLANGATINIDSASATGNVSGRRAVGGLIGHFSPGTGGGTLSNSTASGNVSSFGDAGGLVGAATGTGSISSSSASGSVSSSDASTLSAGGAVGWYNLSLAPTALSASGSVSGASQAGGVIGYYQSNGVLTGASISDTVIGGVTKTVSGNTWVGGLIGYSSSTGSISGLSASANVTATASNGVAGGLIGRTNAAVSSSSASGNVVGVTDVGGLVGRAEGAGGFTDVSATGSASGSGTGSRTGGLIGYYSNSAGLLRGSASGAVTSANIGGGLVGAYTSAGSIQSGSTAVSSTVVAGGYAGGLVGDAAGSATAAITDSTARGAVSSTGASAYVGGLVGDFKMPGGLASVSASGDVSGGARTGGLVGNYSAAGGIATASSTAASVGGTGYVGGLIGYHNGGAVSSASAVAAVTGTNTTGASHVGGLIGRSGGAVSSATASGATTSNTVSTAYVGGLIGSAEGAGSITDGTASGAVSSASTTSAYVGGLVGYASSGSLIRGTATGNVSGGLYTGGLVGQFINSSGATIQNADARGNVSGRGDVGGIVGLASGNGSMSASTATGAISSSDSVSYSVGGAAGYFALGGGMTGIAATGNVAGGTYVGGVVGYYYTAAALSGVTSTAATVRGSNYVGGIVGISTAATMTGLTSAAAVTSTGTGGAAGGLAGQTGGAVSSSTATGNVTAAGDAGGLIGFAYGTGALSTLRATGNVSSTATSAYVGGLIGRVNSGSLDDGRASGAVSGGNYTGGLIGYFDATGNITNSQASGNVSVSVSSHVGGLVGQATGAGSFDNVSATGTVTSTHTGSYAGGLVGQFSKSGGMSNATASGAVSGGNRVGGLVGYYASGGNLASASASGAVSGSSYTGGLVGDFVSSGNLSNATATGAVSGGDYVGGLVGSFNSAGNASTLLASGNVTASGAYAGGLFGLWQYSGTLVDSRATGHVLGANYAGGLVGYGYGNGGINNSSAAGSVSGGTYAGGLVGLLGYTNVTLATATGNVTVLSDSSSYAGGLIGQYYNYNTGASLSGSTASGAVTADSPYGYTGGLVGYFVGVGVLTTSSASGKVTAVDSSSTSTSSQYAGGLVGLFSGASISDSSATGAVVGRYTAGGLVGYYSGTNPMSNVTATGSAEARQFAGGLVGNLESGGLVTGTATGNVRIVGSGGSEATSGGYAGGLIGYATLYNTGGTATGQGSINDAKASGSVSGADYAGGLIGYVYDYHTVATVGTVANSSASGSVSGRQYAGGLVGGWDWAGGTSANRASRGLRSSSASGSVSGNNHVGGLVGYFSSAGGIQDSFATGNVTGRGSTSTIYLGGLSGYYRNLNATVDQGQLLRSYASGNVTLSPSTALSSFTNAYGGGLVGYLDGVAATTATLADSYASGAVSMISPLGRLRAGGLLGFTDTSIARAYATGAVTATLTSSSSSAGGLVAQRASTTATATSSYWATDTSGLATSAIGTASTLDAMKGAATFTGWDIANTGGTTQVWRIYEGQTTPLLRGLLTPITLTLGDIAKVYDGTTSLGSATISVGGIAVTNPQGILVSGISPNAGTYALTAANLYSLAGGYDLSLSGSASLTINRRPLTLDGLVRDKVYDGTTSATLAATPTFGNLVGGEDLSLLTGSGFAVQFASKTAGVDKTVNISGSYAVGDGAVGKASNYIAPTATTTTADITRAVLTAGSFSATNRVYDGTTTVAVTTTSATLGGVIAGDAVTVDLSSATSGRTADKHVGTAKAVTVLGASITGADAANYTLAGVDGVTVNITPKTLTVNGITASDRAYYPSTDVSVGTSSIALSGLVTDDQVQARASGLRGNMADKHVGSSKPVTITGLGLRGLDAGNYTAVAGPVAVNIAPYLLTLYLGTTSTTNRVYDGTTNASVYFPTYWYGGDDITVSTTSIGFADKNVAYNTSGAVVGKTITANGITISGADAANYALQNATATITGTISPKPLAVSGVTAVNRVYDGTRDVTVNISGATVDTTAVISGDVVGVATPGSGSVTGQIANKNVGTSKPVTVPGLALTGADAGNYTITSSSGGGVTVNIARKDLTAVYTASDKVYDGNPYAVFSTTSADIVTGDRVQFYSSPAYCGSPCFYGRYTESGADSRGRFVESRHAGTDKPIVITFSGLFDTDAGNYNLLNPTGTAVASITPKPVTLAFNGTSKVYDGTTTASVALNFGASGLYSGDTLTSTQTAIYTGTGAKNVGTGKPISISDISLGGAHAGNYTVGVTTATTTGTMTAKPITVSGITATDRAYDGTTAVAVTAGTVSSTGFVGGDIVSVALPPTGLSTGTIASKNVGVDKPVTVTGLTLTGADAPNYRIDATASGITVDITSAALTPTYSGGSRVYNGGVAATVTSTTAGIFSGDIVAFSQSAVFTGADARDAGTDKPISVSGIGISGSGAANYALASTTASTTGTITPKPVTPTYSGASRVYNGVADASAAVVGSSLQFVAGDSVGLSETARFTGDGSVGTGKAVSISSIALTGRHATNYSLLSTTGTTTASITPRPLGVTGISATNRTYDGTTRVAVSVAGASVDTSTVVPGDDVSVTLPSSGISTGDMADRHAGNNKPVAITGLTISGTSAANYALIGATGLTVNITPRSLTAIYAGVNKVYDGNAEAAISATSGDILAIDSSVLGFSATGLFTGGKNVGTAKAIDVSGAFLTGAARDNYSLANLTGTATADITSRVLTANYTGGSKVYDGTASAVVTGTLFNRVAGDAVGTSQTAEFTGTGARNVGTGKAISVTGVALTGADKDNYTLPVNTDTTTGSITPKPITVSGLTSVLATDRVYDGTRLVEVTVPSGVTLVPSSADIIAGDTVTIAVPASGVTSGTVASKNVGTGKPVTVDGLTLSGTDAANYSIAGTAGIIVSITPKSLTASYAGINKVYDGGTTATASGTSSDIVAGDGVLIRGTGLFTGSGAKNVGLGKALDITGASLAGTDGGNYVLSNPTGSTTADITPRAITPVYAGGSRVYDGSTAAPVTASVSGFVAGDSVSLSESAFFTGAGARNAGTGKAISIGSIALSGSDAPNYLLTTTGASTTGTVTPKPLSLTGLTGVSATDRVYDGTRTVAVSVTSTGTIAIDPADIVSGDDVSVTPPTSGLTTGTMLTKTAGSNKPLVVDGLALSGADAGNYTVAAASGITVNIARRDLSATFTGVNKVYDGSAAATVVGSSTGIVAGDSVGIAGTGIFSAGKNAGTGLAIAVTGGSLSGIDAANYNLLASTGTATASIIPKTVSATYVGGTRVYDGTTLAPVSGTLSGQIAGDAVTLGQTATFTGSGAKNVGVGKSVSIAGISLSGADASNYSLLAGTATTTATVIPRPLGIIGLTGVSAADREYDGTRNIAVTVSTTGPVSPDSRDLIAGDDVTITAPPAGLSTGTMADKHVGSNKPVAVAGLTLGGADAGNYSVASTSGVSVNITPRTLTPTYTGVSRVYDGTAVATAAGTAAGIVAGDSLSITGTGLFTGSGARNVGTAKPVSVTSATMTGLDAGNYLLASTTASTTADITPRALSNSYLGGTRVYDGTTAAPVTRTTTGVIAGDAVTVGETATFQGGGARNAGTGKPVLISSISLSGSDAANYALTATSASTTGSITPRPLNVTGLTGITATDRAYDGTTAVAVNLAGVSGTASIDILSGDDVTLGVPGSGLGGGTMADKHAGSNKLVSLTGLTLSGADATNYEIRGIAGVTVNITPLTVTLTGVSAVDRAYDGTTAVAINTSGGVITGKLAGDDLGLLSSGSTGSMADKHVGSGKAVSFAGLTLGGGDARNYVVAGGSGLTVNITPRTLNPGATVADRVYDGTTGATVTLSNDRIAGDDLTLSGSAIYADRNAGSGIAVTVSGLALGGADARNYLLGASSLATTGNITRAPLSITGKSLAKVYGDTYAFGSADFDASGLVAGETLGSVALASAGAAASAGVAGSPYALSVSGAAGGSFSPANYDISYLDGQLRVTPRPLTITTNSVVRYVGDPTDLSGVGFSLSGGTLAAGDSIRSVVNLVPPGSESALGLAAFALRSSSAVFGSGDAANYALTYGSGVLLVLPKPPQASEVEAGAAGGGVDFALTLVTPSWRLPNLRLMASSTASCRSAVGR